MVVGAVAMVGRVTIGVAMAGVLVTAGVHAMGGVLATGTRGAMDRLFT